MAFVAPPSIFRQSARILGVSHPCAPASSVLAGGLTLMGLAAPSTTHIKPVRAATACVHPISSPGLRPPSAHEVGESTSRCGFATTASGATRAVSHDFSGLLHAVPCRFIAPYNRPWGSPCFQSCQIRRPANTFPNGALPYEAFPSLTAEKSSPLKLAETSSCVHRNLIPSRRCFWVVPESDRVATTRPRPLPVTRPQGVEPPKNPLRFHDVAIACRPMLPWAFFST